MRANAHVHFAITLIIGQFISFSHQTLTQSYTYSHIQVNKLTYCFDVLERLRMHTLFLFSLH